MCNEENRRLKGETARETCRPEREIEKERERETDRLWDVKSVREGESLRKVGVTYV